MVLFPFLLLAETKTWTGDGGDTKWSNPLNWSGTTLPQPSDDVLLDNSNFPGTYAVLLPDSAVIIRTLRINPSGGRNIELMLPPSNQINNAFTVTGPGYGIELNTGAIFRNASGIASGESLSISDSLIIRNGGRYIHQTRGSHANSILRLLSTSPGTENGIFDFDVPRASYTLSVSNRIYGSLELHADAFGSQVNYTCTGANPLLVRGNLRIGHNVNLSIDLSGVNGNIQVDGDYIQEDGQLNLASGIGDNTVLRVKGDLYQSPTAVITETNSGYPFLELNGERLQEISLSGQILNQVGFRLNNKTGSILRVPLFIPWRMQLKQGPLFTSSAILTLGTDCEILADSSDIEGSYIDGPLRKLNLVNSDHFLFPVGKNGYLHWLELKNATGNYTVEYFRQDPSVIGEVIGTGLDHISKIEYWSVLADGLLNNEARVELSFSSAMSGGVTDPDFINVAKFQSGQWVDGGHSSVTGNFLQGSVLSTNTDFAASEYTLGSTINLAYPLPVTNINLEIKEISNHPVFSWTIESPAIPDHFDLFEESGGQSNLLATVNAIPRQFCYSLTGETLARKGEHYFRIRMTDIQGREYIGKIVPFTDGIENINLYQVTAGAGVEPGTILIRSDSPHEWNYEIISIQGQIIEKSTLKLREGINIFNAGSQRISPGAYIFRASDISGKRYTLLFIKS